MSSKDPEVYRIPPGIPVIETDEHDLQHEAWATEWTEFQEPQYGPNWRLVLFSVLRASGALEFALIRQYEYAGKDVILHLSGTIGQWEAFAIPHAQRIAKLSSPSDPKYAQEMKLQKTTWKDISEV